MTSLKAIIDQLKPLLELKQGSPDIEISGICAPSQDVSNSICFIPSEKALTEAFEKPKAAIVVPESLLSATTDYPGPVMISPAVSLAMAKVGQSFFRPPQLSQAFDGHKIHPSAVISKSANIHSSVIVGPNVTIGHNVKIGQGSIIGANTTIEHDVQIGQDTHIHNQVSVSFGTHIGNNCEIHPQTSLGTEGFGYAQDAEINHHRITHFGRLVIEDNVHIGAGVTMDKGTFEDSRIGKGTIIDNFNHFGHNFVCGEKNIVVGGNIFAGSVTMGSYCVIGGRTTVAGHLNIGDQVQIAGMSGVTKDVPGPGKYGGYPLQPLKDSLKTLSTLTHLPQMRKQLNDLTK